MSERDDERKRRFIAPGKLMLAGEYAVLTPGGEALAVALEGCGVEVVTQAADRWEISWADADGLTWRDGEPVPAQLTFACGALAASRAAFEQKANPSPHRLVTRTFPPSGAEGKRGVGGSASTVAAITVACNAVASRGPAASTAALLAVALEAHRGAQRGRGSGYDVATVMHGGLVHYRPRGRAARQLRWPAGLEVISGYSGQSASTGAFLGRISRISSVDQRGLAVELAELGAAARTLIRAFEDADLRGIVDTAVACQQALARWDTTRGLGIVTSAIARMVELARDAGAAAKVSGAGGGDSVVAFAADREACQRAALAWREEGFSVTPLDVCEQGAQEVTR